METKRTIIVYSPIQDISIRSQVLLDLKHHMDLFNKKELLLKRLKIKRFSRRIQQSKQLRHTYLFQLACPVSGADWPCLHLGNARWTGRVEVKNGHFYVEKGDFGIF